MADIFTKKKRSEVMSKIRHKDSKIEVAFRKRLWAEGFRYSKNSTKYFGKPDIAMPKYKTVIFVDSCFWHGCKKHGSIPVTRSKFWTEKIIKNKTRDKKVSRYYRECGWSTLRIWEHDILKNKEIILSQIIKILKERQAL